MKSAFVLLLSLLLASPAILAGPVRVASLSTVLTDITRNVGGDRVEITEIVKAGTDPHLYEPTPGDIRKISEAQLVLASGLGFESYLDKLRSSVGKGPRFVVAGDVVKPLLVEESTCTEEHDHSHAHAHGPDGKIADPHWWHSIRNVKAAAAEIKNALIAVDPAGKEAYEKNARTFDGQLDDLARWARVEISALPKARRILVTSHDALGYFAADYGFKVRPVQGISTSDQPSSRKVRALIDEIKADGVKAIFAENIENPKVLQQITKETGASLGGTLYADGLGTGTTGTYEGMMRHNVSTIISALK